MYLPTRCGSPPQSTCSADEHYTRAFALEDADPDRARAAYEACLEADPDHVEARNNLGRLLHIAGRLDEAEQVFRAAHKPEALLVFNLGVSLESLDRELGALVADLEALALEPK